MQISQVAKAAGVGVETVRFYEREGLVQQPKKPRQGYRSYSTETVERIRFIREAQELGFTLRETSELLSLHTDPAADCAVVRRHAEAKLADVSDKISRLRNIAQALETLVAACPGRGSTQVCSILDALNHRSDRRLDARKSTSRKNLSLRRGRKNDA